MFDNWQHGTLLVAIPDAVAGEAEGNVDATSTATTDGPSTSTSCDNQYFANKMGACRTASSPTPAWPSSATRAASWTRQVPDELPNGVDFWWDE